MTNVRLAEAVGLSPSPCLQRVKRLEKAGFIKGYRAQIVAGKLTESMVVFTEVTLADHRKEDFKRFEREIARIDNIQEMHLVSGGYDYLLKFQVRNMIHYQDIISDVLEKNIGVEKYFKRLKALEDENAKLLAEQMRDMAAMTIFAFSGNLRLDDPRAVMAVRIGRAPLAPKPGQRH